jgi:NAD(P)-dependent dehydrogenase (short-subunit alcohol dehydrogenase family)
MFSRTVALEMKRDGIRVRVVTPSLIAGTATADRLFADELGVRVFEKIVEKAHIGLPDADEVASTIVWHASPDAAKVTGQVISVNGGISVA